MAHRAEIRKDAVDIIDSVPRNVNVLRSFLRDDSAVKRLIDLEEEMLLNCGEDQIDLVGKAPDTTPRKTACDILAAGSKAPYAEICKNLTGPQRISTTTEELSVPRPESKPYRNSVVLDENTIAGRAFPIKFRVRRRPGNCKECGMKKKILCTPTENTNVVLLSNCCDVMVWPSQKIEQMDKVPVTLITGIAKLTEYVLEETTKM